jgi:hypothetical protein
MKNWLCVLVLLPPLAAAEGQRSRADSLLEAGALTAAESAYYAASRARPHDPTSRRALARYLAERGAKRVAAVLLEEARTFGGDSALIARDLVPLYRELDDYRALAALPGSTVSDGERQRARWLIEHQTVVDAPDSVTMPYVPPTDDRVLGRVALRVQGQIFDASIDPRVRGIVVDRRTTAASRLRRFPARDTTAIPAVADSVRLGSIRLANVPVTIASLGGGAVVGLDVVDRFAPTFDAKARQLTMRAAGAVSPFLPGVRLPTRATPTDLLALQGSHWVSVTTPVVAMMLRTHKWTMDAKRGSLVVQ